MSTPSKSAEPRTALADCGRLISEIEQRIGQGHMSEAVLRLHDLEDAVRNHFSEDVEAQVRAEGFMQPRLVGERELARGLLWAAHAGFRYADQSARTTVCAVADLRRLLAEHARRQHPRQLDPNVPLPAH